MALDHASILVTGGCGQIGMAITDALRMHYPTVQVHSFDLYSPSMAHEDAGVTYHLGDITSRDSVIRLLRETQPKVIFHTAGLLPSVAEKTGKNTEQAFESVNVEGTRILLEEAKRLNCTRAFILTSSSDVVKATSWAQLRGVDEDFPVPDRFDAFYAKSKARAEILVLSASTLALPTTALRTHAVFSANDNNMLPLLISAPRNIHMGSGRNLYDFTYAPNLAEAHILAALNLLEVQPIDENNFYSAAGKAYFVTNAEPCQFRTFVTAVWMAYDNVEKSIAKGTSIPKNFAVPLVWMNEKVSKISGKKPTLTSNALGDSMAARFFDNSRAKEVLGYQPRVKLADAIKEAVRGYKIRLEQERNHQN
ncbi:sterol-4-alpha-carboxylate 3-dehydrogenase [Phlyctema vagabunda]|uniref:Sterol-4-alpha-carboxylate 3-dehydrogenase n=1 Tax=Phlyctema vagabunda TaxID=108571 RepID=A0ABR4PJ99_9HELO